MINPGEFNEKINMLALTLTDNSYTWSNSSNLWTKAERMNGNNIFSSVGLAAKSVKFTIRKCGITLNNAFRWNGKHCFLTDIVEIERKYYEVTAALIEPKTCIVERTSKDRNSLNRPVISTNSSIVFPGCLIEKYLGSSANQEKPMTVTEMRYVLVTPKPIELEEGEIVEIDSVPYEVMLLHTLDEYKNEYEIKVRSEP